MESEGDGVVHEIMRAHRRPVSVDVNIHEDHASSGGTCHHICAFFGSFGFFVQFVLAVLSFSALLFKRYQENPRRPIAIFRLDALKNGMGASLVHFLNIFIALRLARGTDPCPWYLIQIVLDTTVVIFANYMLLRWLENTMLSVFNVDVTSGNYGVPPDLRRWLQQLGVWFVVVIVCKVAMVVLLVTAHAGLSTVATLILSPLCFNPHLELFIVVVFLPLILNAFSFWVMDDYLKFSTGGDDAMGGEYGKLGGGLRGDGSQRRNTALTEAFGGQMDYGSL